MTIPTDAQFFSRNDPTKPDIAFLKNHFYREGRVSEEHALFILEKGTELLKAEPNLLHVDAPVTGMFSQAYSVVTCLDLVTSTADAAQCAATFMDNTLVPLL